MIVVKVGGSLYDHPRLGPGLRTYLDTLPEPVLLVPGGGEFADAVRKLDALHQLGEESSHWLALHAMNLAGEFLRQLGVKTPMIDALEICMQLPHSWDVTSDSIAAHVAISLNASRLILLKSVDIPIGTSWAEAADRGWVDRHFPSIMANSQYGARRASKGEDPCLRVGLPPLTAPHALLVEIVNFREVLNEIQ